VNNFSAAEAAAKLDREVLVLRRNFEEMFALIEAGESIPVDRRVRFRYDSARAVSTAMEVVDELFTNSGGRVLFEGNFLHRAFQDIHAIRQHHANGLEKPGSNFGAVQFGGRNTDFFI